MCQCTSIEEWRTYHLRAKELHESLFIDGALEERESDDSIEGESWEDGVLLPSEERAASRARPACRSTTVAPDCRMVVGATLVKEHKLARFVLPDLCLPYCSKQLISLRSLLGYRLASEVEARKRAAESGERDVDFPEVDELL